MITKIHTLLLKELLLSQIQMMQIMIRSWLLQIMLHLFCAFQNLIIDFIDNEEDILMPTQNLIECSKNYSKTTESLSNFYRDKPNKGEGGQNNSVNYSIKY